MKRSNPRYRYSYPSLGYDSATASERRTRRTSSLPERDARSPYGRPDRVAFWAVAMAVIAMIAAVASAHASSGGLTGGTGGGGGGGGGCAAQQLGKRTLALGDCGKDVKTLNWILKSKNYGRQVRLRKSYKAPTKGTVETFQSRKGISANGVFTRRTHKKLVKSMSKDVASYYGPGLYGNKMACGRTLKHSTVGVAHKTLPCGTKVVIKNRGKFVRTKVVDRGPYAPGVTWDLTEAAAKQIGLTANSNVRSAVIR